MTGAVAYLADMAALARGDSGGSCLLQTCRLCGWGIEFYGIDAITEAFRRQPQDFSETGNSVAVPVHLAMFDADTALIADLAEGGIQRLWRLGPGAPAPPEPRIDVAFDPDLMQAGSGLAFAASDHPALKPDAIARVRAIGVSITDRPAGEQASGRARAFALRAFGDASCGAALFAIHRLGSGPVRTAGFANVAALWSGDTLHIVRDIAGEAAVAAAIWSPVISA